MFQEGILFTESAHWPNSVSKLQYPSVCCLCHFLLFFMGLITPIYKVEKSNPPIAKRFLREKLRNDIGLEFSNIG